VASSNTSSNPRLVLLRSAGGLGGTGQRHAWHLHGRRRHGRGQPAARGGGADQPLAPPRHRYIVLGDDADSWSSVRNPPTSDSSVVAKRIPWPRAWPGPIPCEILARILRDDLGQLRTTAGPAVATKQQRLNGAEGKGCRRHDRPDAAAESIRPVAEAAEAVEAPGGYQAVQLLVAEQYVDEPGLLATETNTMIVPANVNESPQSSPRPWACPCRPAARKTQGKQPRAGCWPTGLRDAPGAFADSGLPTSPRRLAPARRAGRW